MKNYNHLLIVEDAPSLARTYEAHLADCFQTIEIAQTRAEALDSIERTSPSCILLDLKLPDGDGLDLLDDWMAAEIPAPIIVITGNGSMKTAVDAMRRGAADFLVKPTGGERLHATIKNAIEKFQLRKLVANYEAETERTDFHNLIGRSLGMQGVFKTIEAAAQSKASVMITGDTGTGKELVAQAVHDMSVRRRAKFVAINCGAIPKDLIESQLFGHVKGAFTGATTDRVGAAELAHNGTLFLDELGEMPIELQPKLLRFLQSGEYARVGESRTRIADIRVIAATNRNPLQAIRDGRLREDLYYRLHVVPISIPRLADRGGDVLLLASSFLETYGREEGKTFEGFDRGAEEWLVSHDWPGNVRELENMVRQIVVLNEGGRVTRSMLPQTTPSPLTNSEPRTVLSNVLTPPHVSNGGAAMPSLPPEPEYGIEPLWLTEKKAIERAIALCRGNVSAAAERLGINASTIYRKKSSWAEAESEMIA